MDKINFACELVKQCISSSWIQVLFEWFEFFHNLQCDTIQTRMDILYCVGNSRCILQNLNGHQTPNEL